MQEMDWTVLPTGIAVSAFSTAETRVSSCAFNPLFQIPLSLFYSPAILVGNSIDAVIWHRSLSVLPMPLTVMEALRAHRVRQLEERLFAVRRWDGSPDLVFTTPIGT